MMPGLRVGSVVDNKYEVIRSLDQGGMAVVWLAQDKRLGKLWAVKEVKRDDRSVKAAYNRRAIIDEANFMKRLEHHAIPRVVDIIDTGETVFVVMDYVNGTALNRVLAEQGEPFQQEEVINWGIQLCDALDYLHGLRPPVIYRDMKPANVMLRADGAVMLIDFGISLEMKPGEQKSANRAGTAGYSAPEQIDKVAHERYPLDERADIYALGTTLYTLVTGHTPRLKKDGKTETVDFDVRPIREIDPRLSDGLEQIILKATQPIPDDRYQTIGEMRYALEHYQELTEEWRVAQRNKVKSFTRWVKAAAISVGVGVACLGASALVRNSSYDSLMHEATIASADERNVVLAKDSTTGARLADASEAEEYFTRAIEVAPNRIDPYLQLINTYKADDVFTPTEASRWVSIWQSYGRNVRDDDNYARLCYDCGVLYLCYYDYLGTRDQNGGSDQVVSGQAALENASRASVWFKNALDVCDAETGEYRGLQVDERLDEYSALLAYQTISDFHDKITRANREGADVSEEFKEFWGAISESISSGGMIEQTEPIVQLRLLQVAFESISSATNLTGFKRAGIEAGQAMDLLDTVKVRVDGLQDFIESNSVVAGPIADEILGGYDKARANILHTFNGPTSRVMKPNEGGRK